MDGLSLIDLWMDGWVIIMDVQINRWIIIMDGLMDGYHHH